MTTPEQSHEPLATADQVAVLFAAVGVLTTFRGEHLRSSVNYYGPVEDMPPEVAKHLPVPDETSKMEDSVYSTQKIDPGTGQPLRSGLVGMVCFTRTEMPVPGVSYQAHVNYHITTGDGGVTYGVERHVTQTEAGTHLAAEAVRAMGRMTLDPMEAALAMRSRLSSLVHGTGTAQPLEQAMGMFDVTETEAEQLIGFVQGLHGEI